MSRRAAPLANQWWSQRFTAVLEGYGLGPRMERGRRYARGGRVQELLVKAGRLEARVQGSRAARLGWTAQLLNGEVPRDLEEPFAAVGVPLFPRRWGDLQVRCGCPDDAVPCKHIAAVLYVFAQRLDEDPWLLLAWHGRDREQLLASLRCDAPEPPNADGLPSWWPVGLRARPAPRLQPPDPLPGMDAGEMERRLAGLYRQLLEGEGEQGVKTAPRARD